MSRFLRNPIAEILWFCLVSVLALAQFPEPLPKLNYTMIPDFFQLPPGEHFIEPAGVAVMDDGRLLLADTNNHRVLVYDVRERSYRTWAE